MSMLRSITTVLSLECFPDLQKNMQVSLPTSNNTTHYPSLKPPNLNLPWKKPPLFMILMTPKTPPLFRKIHQPIPTNHLKIGPPLHHPPTTAPTTMSPPPPVVATPTMVV